MMPPSSVDLSASAGAPFPPDELPVKPVADFARGKVQNYHRPDSLDKALRLLDDAPMTVAAGCTDLFPGTQRKSLPGAILDIERISDLSGINLDESGMRIGATVTWTELINADLPPAVDMLKQAGREVGSVQIQNAGTIVGNICNASPAADSVPCLLALDARVEIRSLKRAREIPLSAFITGSRSTDLARGELVTAIIVPAAALHGNSRFLKLGARAHLVISIAMVAARLSIVENKISQCALAVGACSPVAVRLTDLETHILGASPVQAITAVSEADIGKSLAPIDDHRSDANYRCVAATELLRRVVSELAAPAEVPA